MPNGLVPSPSWVSKIGRSAVNMVVLLLMLLYLASPIDFIPDIMFPVGFIDDILVLLAGLSYLGFDLTRTIGIKR